VAKGAALLCGGERDGTIMKATVLDRVTPEMRIYSEESFGPVVCMVRVRGVDEAIRVANDTDEFIPIRPLAARESGAPGSYAGHS
jgi:acyl-CoA reductase-like NAD-dependent aldehyde dehydrogenase